MPDSVNRCVHCGMRECDHSPSANPRTCRNGSTTFATMALPQGWTCAECVFFRFCKDFISRAGHETSCDWYPVRFSIDPAKVTRKEPSADVR
jgi:hypothetical protein